MEITQLRVSVTEQDLNELLRRHVPPGPVEDLKVGLTPQGMVIQGAYPIFVKVAFETLWELNVQQGKLTAKLAQLKAMGVPGGMFKGAILKQLADAFQGKDFVGLVDDTIILDVDRLIQRSGVTGKTNLTKITCEAGRFMLEAG